MTLRIYAAVFVVLGLAAHGLMEEELVARVDLLGWMRAERLVVESECWDARNLVALLDDDPTSIAAAADTAPARWTLAFDTPCVVRHVGLVLDNAASVSLTVVEAGGARFAAGDVDVAAGARAAFTLRDVPVDSLEFAVVVADATPLVVTAFDVHATMTIVALDLVEAPTSLPERGSFPVIIRGTDSRGGRTDLTELASVVVSPQRALTLTDDGRAVARVGGPVTLMPTLGTLTGPRVSLLVAPLAATPRAPLVEALGARATVEMTGTPPFEVLRRTAGEKEPESLATTVSTRWHDTGVDPGSAYLYAFRSIDAFGNPTSPISPFTRARIPARRAEEVRSTHRLPILVTLFADDSAESLDDVRAALDAARMFVFRHTRGQALLDIDVITLAGPTPDLTGPSMALVERRLRSSGVREAHYAFVYAISDRADGAYSGFELLDDTPAGFGPTRGALPATPRDTLGPLPFVTWTFLHEFNHALELSIGPAAGVTMHPSHHVEQDIPAGRLGAYVGRAFDAGEGWDGLAHVYALFPDWTAVPPRYADIELFVDTDGDGLADDAPRLPVDERRFGADATRIDSDDDGLDDFAEWCAGLYAGSSPVLADTDGDGLRDGDDPHPLANVAATLPHGVEPQRIASGPTGRASILLDASWTPDALHLAITTSTPSDIFIDLDGSGALGRWESDVRVGGTSDVWAGPARLALRAHSDPRGVFVGDRLLEGVALATSATADGRVVIRVSLPATLGPGAADVFVPAEAPSIPGLRLAPGTVLGLAFTVRPSIADDPTPFDTFAANRPWTSLFALHRLVDITLGAP